MGAEWLGRAGRMIVLSFDAATAQRIVAGDQTVVTYPSDLVWDGPVDDLNDLVGQTVAVARLSPEWRPFSPSQGGVSPETGGAIVGSVTVAACVPIVDDYENVCHGYDGPAAIEFTPSGHVLYCEAWDGGQDEDTIHDLTDQAAFADFTPGRWALILTDPAPCEQRCLVCTFLGGHDAIEAWDTHNAPAPYSASGPISEWAP